MSDKKPGAASTTPKRRQRPQALPVVSAFEATLTKHFSKVGVLTERVYGRLNGEPEYARQVGKWLIYIFGLGREWGGQVTQLCVVDDFGNLVAVQA